MPLHIGNTNIGAIYKGTTPISSIYKGTTLVFSSYSWQEYLYEYLYHNLVPTTINNKQVQDKAKLVEIQGNSCVVNQLCEHYYTNSSTVNGITKTYDQATGTYHFVGTNTSSSRYVSTISRTGIDYRVALYSNHIYYFYGLRSNLSQSSAYVLFSGVNANKYLISTNGLFISNFADTGWFEVRIDSGATVDFYVCPQFVDLTKQFPFDTPTTLDDPRVKRIIEQGYIPYNSGEIKDSVIGEISSQGYNLFDKDNVEIGLSHYITSSGYVTDSVGFDYTYDYIAITFNDSYILENMNPNGGSNPCIAFYDKSKIFISAILYNGSNSLSFTTPANAFYCRFSIGKTATNVSLHRTGTRTGYADYIPQQYLPSEYQEVEYLESSGTQYIDTGLTTSTTIPTKYKCEIGYWQTSSANQNMGADYGAWFGLNTNNIYIFGLITQIEPSTNAYDKIIFEQDFTNNVQKMSINGRTPFSRSYSNWSSYPIYLFGLSTGSYPCYCRIKHFEIYQNNILVRSFIPCYRKSDNVAGLYDLVNNLFYTNNGTGTFAIGKKVNNNTIIHLPAPLDLGGVNTAHNTFAITKTNYVFTRNVFDVDLGTLNWTYEALGSGDNYYSDVISNAVQYSEVLCDKYNCDMSVSPSTLRNNAWISQTGRINITADGYSGNATTFKTAMSGVMLKYQLSTPQVINIPRKHLGVIDLGSLTFTRYSFSGTYCFYAQISAMKKTTKNVFCFKYMFNDTNISQLNNKQITVATNYIYIRDDTYTDATDFKNAMSGVYLFYETNAETTDFNDEMFIQSGGTITTDSKVLPNITLGVKCK